MIYRETAARPPAFFVMKTFRVLAHAVTFVSAVESGYDTVHKI